jgi:DNA-binding response OmpR family regulator
LSLGGDDYLTKPFSIYELKARMIALTRRAAKGKPAAGPLLPKGWQLNPLLRQLTVRGETLSLQPREWSLLELFLNHEGEVLTKSFLLDRVWGIQFDPGTNVVDAMVCRLRKRVDAPGEPSHVETLRGRGYIFRRHDET